MRIYSLLPALIVSGCGLLTGPKIPEMTVPRQPMKTQLPGVDPENKRTLLLTGDPQGIIYAYPGKLDSPGELTAIQPDTSSGLANYILNACDTAAYVFS